MYQRNTHRLVFWVVSDSLYWRTTLRLKLAEFLPSPCALTDAPASAVRSLLHHDQPHMVLWDRQSPDWISAVQDLAHRAPEVIQVVIASTWTFEEKTMARALGVHHCLTHAEPLTALSTLLQKSVKPLNSPRAASADNALASLTPREQEIVKAVQRGLDNKSIARLLGISPATVKTHLHHVFDKLGMTRTQLLLRGR